MMAGQKGGEQAVNREQLRALAKEYTRHQGGVFNLQGDDAETCLLIDIIARLLVDCQVSVGRAMYILDEAKKDIANHSVCNIEAGDVESLCRRPSISSITQLKTLWELDER